MSEKYKFRDPEGIYFVTSTIVHWIDLFTRKELCEIILNSLRYCQQEKGLVIYSWCLMPSHLHMIVSTNQYPLSGIMRDFKKHTNKEIIKAIWAIKESRREWLLKAFQESGEQLKRIKKFKVWQDGNHPLFLKSNRSFQNTLRYIHQNPVVAEIVDDGAAYLHSSARDYEDRPGLLKVVFLE